MTRRWGSSEEPQHRQRFALMSLGEVASLECRSLGWVQKTLSFASVLGPQCRSRAGGAKLSSTSMGEIFMHRVRGCLYAPLDRVPLGRNTKMTLIWYLLLGKGLVVTAWGFYECGLEDSRKCHVNNLSSHLIIDRVAQ